MFVLLSWVRRLESGIVQRFCVEGGKSILNIKECPSHIMPVQRTGDKLAESTCSPTSDELVPRRLHFYHEATERPGKKGRIGIEDTLRASVVRNVHFDWYSSGSAAECI